MFSKGTKFLLFKSKIHNFGIETGHTVLLLLLFLLLLLLLLIIIIVITFISY